MPVPTPAKWKCDRLGRPAAVNRSNTSAEPNTMTSALQTPPAKRRMTNAAIDGVAAMAPVDSTLKVSAQRVQLRRSPFSTPVPPASEPTRYPRKFAAAIRPAWLSDNGTASAMNGRMGV